MPDWGLWILMPWVVLHLVYDMKIGDELRDASGGTFNPFVPFAYMQVLREIQRRYRAGDPIAVIVTWYDRLMITCAVGALLYALVVSVRGIGR